MWQEYWVVSTHSQYQPSQTKTLWLIRHGNSEFAEVPMVHRLRFRVFSLQSDPCDSAFTSYLFLHWFWELWSWLLSGTIEECIRIHHGSFSIRSSLWKVSDITVDTTDKCHETSSWKGLASDIQIHRIIMGYVVSTMAPTSLNVPFTFATHESIC